MYTVWNVEWLCHVTGTEGDDIPLCGYHDMGDEMIGTMYDVMLWHDMYTYGMIM